VRTETLWLLFTAYVDGTYRTEAILMGTTHHCLDIARTLWGMGAHWVVLQLVDERTGVRDVEWLLRTAHALERADRVKPQIPHLPGAGAVEAPGVLPSRARPRARSQARVVPAKGPSGSPSPRSK
jgi:hypothetical protein